MSTMTAKEMALESHDLIYDGDTAKTKTDGSVWMWDKSRELWWTGKHPNASADCTECGMVHSFFFGTTFHKEGCTNA